MAWVLLIGLHICWGLREYIHHLKVNELKTPFVDHSHVRKEIKPVLATRERDDPN